MKPESQPSQSPAADVLRVFHVVEITRYPDGTITCHDPCPCIPASSDPGDDSTVLSRDVEINQGLGTWARIYLPPTRVRHQEKLPLLVYFHGGGFVCLSPSMVLNHSFCSGMAASLPAVVVSVGYRRAPEHRLPAAYDDAFEALRWIQTAEDEWLDKFADFTDCYLMGTSSGANIAYHAALKVCKDETAGVNPKELKIKGLIMHSPFFGGLERTESELRLFDDALIPVPALDLFWEQSLPVGADRNHEYCSLKSVDRSAEWEKMKSLKWKVMVTGGEGDPLVDRQREVVAVLEGKGLEVVKLFGDGIHAAELADSGKAQILFEKIKSFMI
ncbi:hypothetical protein MLD38_002857 [Melastoma candidum]|uniref:Uncharacterized protein n=1 Tax=Melastoma candidum TaxID=119954 RepID=A0ACB9S2P0_9MYRT|nr:hypothetical protein MLD38_002857 [Melastoma candidum]